MKPSQFKSLLLLEIPSPCRQRLNGGVGIGMGVGVGGMHCCGVKQSISQVESLAPQVPPDAGGLQPAGQQKSPLFIEQTLGVAPQVKVTAIGGPAIQVLSVHKSPSSQVPVGELYGGPSKVTKVRVAGAQAWVMAVPEVKGQASVKPGNRQSAAQEVQFSPRPGSQIPLPQ